MAPAETTAAWLSFMSSVDAQASSSSAPKAAVPLAWPGVAPLCAAGLADLLASHCLDRLEAALRDSHLRRFWSHFEGYARGAWPALRLEATLAPALQELCATVEQHAHQVAALSAQLLAAAAAAQRAPSSPVLALRTRYRRAAGALLLTSAPLSLPGLLEEYYQAKLADFSRGLRRGARLANQENEPADEEEEAEDDEGEGQASGGSGEDEAELMEVAAGVRAEEVMGGPWAARLRAVAQALRQLGAQAVSDQAYAAAVCRHVQRHIVRRTQRVFDRPVLPAAQAYVAAVPLEFLRLVLAPGETGAAALGQWRARLDYTLYETVGRLRTSEMFDMVVDYPDSLPALADVRDCLASTSLHTHFIAGFRSAIQQRLLHAGAATSDIIQQYVSTIKALRVVDPAGLLLEAVGGPIRDYLRARKDTIRCIVTSLTDDSAGEAATGESLFEELGRSAAGQGGESDSDGEYDDAAAAEAAEAWDPDPVHADAAATSRSRRTHDIISMLVAIYGSKELFINEYRVMLADKLLAKSDYDCDREIRTLELLKLHFGDTNLHTCEVMLKDLADSKRLNTNIKNLPAAVVSPVRGRRHDANIDNLSASIVSGLFWPPFAQETLTLPPQVATQLETYAAKYHSIKAPRKLQWQPAAGRVQLSLSLAGQQLDLSVSPAHAVIIYHFQERREWRASGLAAACGMPLPALRRKAVLWLNKGLLTEARAPGGPGADFVYTLASQMAATPAAGAGAPGAAADEEMPTAVASAEQQLQQEMEVYEQYIMGMLTNFEGLPLERIHNMLKMFVTQPPYDKSADQLAAFLGQLVATEKLAVEGGIFRKR